MNDKENPICKHALSLQPTRSCLLHLHGHFGRSHEVKRSLHLGKIITTTDLFIPEGNYPRNQAGEAKDYCNQDNKEKRSAMYVPAPLCDTIGRTCDSLPRFSTSTSKGSFGKQAEGTVRQLNFLSPGFGAGKPMCGVGWMTISRSRIDMKRTRGTRAGLRERSSFGSEGVNS